MRKIFILLWFILGFLMVPNNAVACKNKSSKVAFHKEISSKKSNDHSCCKSSQSEKNDHNCNGGKCGNSKCVCPSSYLVFLFFSEGSFSLAKDEITFAKQKFPVFQNPLLSGYESLWLIPKIS